MLPPSEPVSDPTIMPTVDPPKEPKPWESAKIIMRPPERVIVCPACGDPRHTVRLTRPEHGITQRVCGKCGVKYAIRNTDTPTPEARVL